MNRILGALFLLAVLINPLSAAELSGGDFQLTSGSDLEGESLASSNGGLTSITSRGGTCGAGGLRTGGNLSGVCGNPHQNTSPYDNAVSNTIADAKDKVSIVVPSGAMPQDFDFFVNVCPAETPQRVDPNMISLANSRMESLGSEFTPVTRCALELNAQMEDETFLDKNMNTPSTLQFKVQDADGDGIVDGSNPPIRTKTLKIYRLDEARGVWEPVESTLDLTAKTVTASLPHLSVYTLLGTADLDVANTHAFPVPWSPNSGDPALGNLTDGIRFRFLPSQGTVSIYDLTGRLVRSLDIPLGIGTMSWNGKTSDGRDAASGVYLWKVKAGKNVKTGKIMILR